MEHLLPGWSFITNYDFAEFGRIWICFDSSIRMEIFSKSAQAVHCHAFSLSLKKYFFLSVVYGANRNAERRVLWEELNMVKSCMVDVPWLACGDFNT